jgi:hypothetical protein
MMPDRVKPTMMAVRICFMSCRRFHAGRSGKTAFPKKLNNMGMIGLCDESAQQVSKIISKKQPAPKGSPPETFFCRMI